ncbi:MAG TPA: hypothetical protein VHO29_11730 [Marmoricola sp.]|nr:hypothetical protein [Marmoricola sp.]
MELKKRALSVVVTMAVTASLAVAPALLESTAATATPNAPARASVTAECAAAHADLVTAKHQKLKAKKRLAQARKALRKAKHSHRPARIKKAKRVVAKARYRFQVRSNHVNVQRKHVAYACSAPTSATRAEATGGQTDMLVIATGASPLPLDLSQLTTLLDRIVPGVSAALTPGQLSALLSGFNIGALSLDDATALLGGTFTPTELQSLLSGAASPALVLELVQHIAGQLSGLTGGTVPVPASIDPTSLLQVIGGLFGNLDASQLGSLLGLLITAVQSGSFSLDATQLTNLLTGLNLPTSLTPTQVTDLLAGANGTLDATTLTNLLGGQFSQADITSVLNHTAGTTLVGQVLANVIAQLGTLDGSALTSPGTVDPTTLTNLVTQVTSLVNTVLTTTTTIVTGVVCTLLPILC